MGGRVAIVTGGSRGIGAATAKHLASEGYALAIVYRASTREADAVVDEIAAAGGLAIAVQADVSNPEACRSAVAKVLERFGRLDVLVNNAGVFLQRQFQDVDPAFFDELFHTNVLGPLTLMQACYPHLGQGGRVINVLSTLAIEPHPPQAIYGATKAALRALTQAYAKDFGRIGATVNAVAPGVILTDMMKDAPPEALARVANETAAGRLGQAEDIAPIIAFLASPQSAWLNGRMLAADGGRTAY
jgi:3-oxoacyl-[acyl-carrier protein] reductase